MTVKESQNRKFFIKHPRIQILLLSIYFFLGIWWGTLGWDMIFLLFWGLIGVSMWVLVGVRIHLSFFFLACILLYLSWFYGMLSYQHRSVLIWYSERFADASVHTLEWKITDLLYQWDFSRTYRHEIDMFDTTSTPISALQRAILLEVPKNIQVNIGDTLRVTWKLFPIYSWSTLEGFERYTWKEGVFGKMKVTTVEVLKKGTFTHLGALRTSIVATVYDSFPLDIAAIILGTTIGNTDFLFKELKNDFLLSGMTHILVVSGSNIAFLIVFVIFFLKYLPIKSVLRSWIVGGVLCFYGYLVWWDIPVVRATIMGWVAYMALFSGRRVASGTLLILTGTIMVLLDPYVLLYDVWFWLSFWATAGIIVIERIRRATPFTSSILKRFWPFVSLTLWASLWSLPVLLFHFGTISLWSFFANIVSGPLLGLNLLMSVVFLFGSFILPDFFLYLIGYIPYILSSILIWIAQFFGWAGLVSLDWLWIQLLVPFLLFFFCWLFLQTEKNIILDPDQKDENPQFRYRGL